MPDQKMKITDEQFSDYTGTMFNTPFTHSVSDVSMSERGQARLNACFKSEPEVVDPPEEPTESEGGEEPENGVV